MKHLVILILTLFVVFLNANAQKYYTKNGEISFFSKAPLEDIKADNNQVVSVLNTATGDLQFSLPNNAFHFKKAKMEEDFNEDYIESAKYPKSTFKGKITNFSEINFSKDGSYTATVSGDLNLHGVTKTVKDSGTITIQAGKISAASKFFIMLKDYNIKIPKIVKDNIAEKIEISVSCNYDSKL